MASDRAPRRERTVLDEAKGLVHGDRNEAYGTPADDFGRAAGMLTALFSEYLQEGRRFTASDIAKIQIVVKLSRLMHNHKRDSWVDVAGYAETGDWAEEDSAERNARPGLGGGDGPSPMDLLAERRGDQ